uniref:Histone-lysine N-methyltransferase ASHH1 isoform X2 n=1 Tax=Rhizophora mucronata TaxID=61149 RepID=A0A2P2K3Q0_RHIMU
MTMSNLPWLLYHRHHHLDYLLHARPKKEEKEVLLPIQQIILLNVFVQWQPLHPLIH